MAETIIYGTEGGMNNGKGTLVCNAQLGYELTSAGNETYTYVCNLSVHNVRYGYKTTGMLHSSIKHSDNSSSETTTTGGDCNLTAGSSKLLQGPLTYNFSRTHDNRSVTITFSVRATGNVVSGTSTGYLVITIPAKPSYTITYQTGGGSWTGTNPSTTKWYGESLTVAASSVVNRTGYNFTGWKDQNGNSYSPGASIGNTALTLTAQWTLAYIKPTLSNAQAFRVASSSATTASDSGTHIRVMFNYTCGHNNGSTTYNSLSYSISIGGSAVKSGSFTATSSTGSFAENFGSNYALDSIYTVTIKIWDATDTTGTTKNLTISAATIPIDLLVNGSKTYMGLMTAAIDGTPLQVPSLNSIGPVTIGGAITASGAISCTSLTGSGQVQGATLKSTGNTTVGGALTTTGNVSIGGTLTAGTLGFIKAITTGQSYARNTAMGTITKTVTITNAGFITLTASIICEEDYSDTGTWYVGIAHNDVLRAGSGGRFTSSITPAIGGSATVNLAVANGDKLVITFINTKISKKRWDITGLCFNCTATIA